MVSFQIIDPSSDIPPRRSLILAANMLITGCLGLKGVILDVQQLILVDLMLGTRGTVGAPYGAVPTPSIRDRERLP